MSELELLAQQLVDAQAAGNAWLDARFCAAMNNMDVDSVMECFLDAPDLVVVCGNVLRGPAAVRGCLVDLFSKSRSVCLTIDEVTHWNAGETTFSLGTATCELEAVTGTRSTFKECWTDARQKVVGRWVYILGHATRIA